MGAFFKRLVAVLTLDTEVYSEIASDPKASIQSVAVVLLSSLPTILVSGVLGGAFVAAFVVLLWGGLAVSLFLCNKLIPQPAPSISELIAENPTQREPAPVGISEILRSTGFAYAPRLFADSLMIPLSLLEPGGMGVTQFVTLGVRLWVIAAYTASISSVFDTTMWRALILMVVSALPLAALGLVIVLLSSHLAPS